MDHVVWDALHAAICDAAKEIACAGKLDDAIFAAFRVVEAEIQERINSRSIGDTLLDEAFNGVPPQIDIVDDSRDQTAIKSLFAGAFRHIRNDRGHKRVPFLPCPNLSVCFQYLAFASLLLYLLSRDRNRFPKAQAVRISGSRDQPRAEIRGENLERVTRILASDAPAPIVRMSQSAIEVILPSRFSGFLRLESEYGVTTEIFCDCHSLEPRAQNLYQVIAADIPLYADRHCKIRRETVVGLLYSVLESGRQHTKIIPTVPGRYQAGQYLSHGPFEDEAVEESWYRDPRNGQIREAWSGALIAKPQILGELGESRYGSIRVFPSTVHTEVNEQRTLNVRAYKSDGSAWREEDVTSITHWKSSNVRVAFVKGGILYPKEFGSVTIEAEWQGLFSSAEIEVAHLSPGQRTVYYQGLRRLQRIRFDEADNLYIVNQSRSIFRLNRSGGLDEVVRIVIDDAQPTGLDCVCVDNHRNLIASTPYKEHCLRFEWNGSSYGTPMPVGQSVPGTKKAIAAAQDGTLFIAVMTGSIIRVRSDGSEDAFHTRDSTINVTVGPNGLIYTTSTNERAVHVYQPDGKFVETIPHGIADSPADLFVDSAGTIYLPFFNSGKLLQISSGQLSQVTFIAEELGNPGGIAMDSKGRIYMSDFSGDVIYLLNQPRSTTTERM